MCGLVAMITKNRNGFSTHNLDAFASMLFVDQLRGPDSTGVFLVNNIGNVEIAKSAQNASDFLNEQAWKMMRMDAIRNGWAMVGHNRKATRGEINDKNAHPFWVDEKLVLVHNGSYYGDHKHHKDTEVDSEAIAHALAEGEDIETTLQSINAAYALIWYEVEKKKLHVIRNSQRPLYWMETADAYYFCSETDFLNFAAARAGLTVLGKGPHSFDIASLDSWTLEEDRSSTLETADLNINYKPAKPAESAGNFHQSDSDSRHLACAWGFGDVEVEAMNLDPYPEPALTQAINEANRIASEAIRLASEQGQREREKLVQVETKQTIGPDWAEKYTLSEWEQAKKIYTTGHRIKVECRDYLADDAGPGKVYLAGKTMDNWGLYVIFPVDKKLFSAITSPDSVFSKEKKTHFMVTVDGCGWRARDANEVDGKGLITLIGASPKVLMVGNSVIQ